MPTAFSANMISGWKLTSVANTNDYNKEEKIMAIKCCKLLVLDLIKPLHIQFISNLTFAILQLAFSCFNPVILANTSVTDSAWNQVSLSLLKSWSTCHWTLTPGSKVGPFTRQLKMFLWNKLKAFEPSAQYIKISWFQYYIYVVKSLFTVNMLYFRY